MKQALKLVGMFLIGILLGVMVSGAGIALFTFSGNSSDCI